MSELKLYHGGCGTSTGYAVAKNEKEGVQELSRKLGIPFLPVEVQEIKVEGYKISIEPLKDDPEEPKKDKASKASEKVKNAVKTDEHVPETPTGKEGGEVIGPDRTDSAESEGQPEASGSGDAPERQDRAGEKPDK